MTMENQNEPPEPIKKNVKGPIPLKIFHVPEIKIWRSANFAEDWFKDASEEAKKPVWSNNSSSLAVSETLTFFKWDECIEGTGCEIVLKGRSKWKSKGLRPFLTPFFRL